MTTYKELFGYIWRFMRRQKWTFFFILLLDSFSWPLEVLVWPYILHFFVDIFAQYEVNRLAAWGALTLPIIGVIALVVYVEIASRAMGFLMAKGMPILQADIRMNMFEHIQKHSPRYFNERFAGNLANKITDMTTKVELIIQHLWWPIIPAISACFMGSIFLYFVSPIFAWILLGWSIIHIGICILFSRPIDVYEHRHGEARSTLLGMIVDSLTNNFAVNLFHRFKYERSVIEPFQKDEEETNIQAKRYVEKLRCCLSIFYFFVVIIGMYGLLLYMWVHGQISTGQTVQVVGTMWSLTMLLWSVGSEFSVIFQALGIAKQAYSIMKDPNDLGDKPDAKRIKISKGSIVFDKVSFNYGNCPLFTKIQTKISGGAKVGLVGFTGTGKSTFINLLLRLFPLDQGKILIDDQEIASITLKSLRSQIALIPQEPILFHRTLLENIKYGKPTATKADVIKAAKQAHCHEFINNLPQGYDTLVGERGTKLSGGERQRIAIARAILANPKILLLDEATSALDSVTEKYIKDSLDKLMEDRTTLVIAHRLSTLSHLDTILVFDRGEIVEEGTHPVLLAKEGRYAQMWKAQVGGFLPEQPKE